MVARIESKVVAPLAVLCLVVNRASFDFNFACAEVSLEVLAVVAGVVKTPFNKRNKADFLFARRLVCQSDLLYFAVFVNGNHVQNVGGDSVLFRSELCVAKAVAAFVLVKLGLSGLPAGVPNCVAVFDEEVAAVVVKRNVVVAVAGQAAQARVRVKGVSARSV